MQLTFSVYRYNPEVATEDMVKRDVNMAPKLREAFPPKVRSY